MSKNLTIFRKFEFGPYKTVCELPGINAKWTDVSRNLLAVLGNAFPENNLKDSLTFFIGFAEYECNKVGRESEG
jgi:hypothetical protein